MAAASSQVSQLGTVRAEATCGQCLELTTSWAEASQAAEEAIANLRRHGCKASDAGYVALLDAAERRSVKADIARLRLERHRLEHETPDTF